MKVKVLSRNPDVYLRETIKDIHKVPRNYDPKLHPFEAAREYTRALNSVKLSRVFAKPFIGCLEGHNDGISCVGKHPGKLSLLYSGAFDGEIKIWNLPAREVERSILAHNGIVRGIAFNNGGDHFFSVGDDKKINMWKCEKPDDDADDIPVKTIVSQSVITGISHHQTRPVYATCGEVCLLWEETKNVPKKMKWGVDTLQDIKFNPVQTDLLAGCSSDRGIILYDTREKSPLRKLILKMRTNKLSWNPMEAFTFTCANEDYNLYTFDIRKWGKPVNVHMDHVNAVIDVDYSPTGKEFVSGSYDRTVRIFEAEKGHSREVYHTKRMQRLTSVMWSLDNKYIISGSDEMNLRIWKAKASEKLGPMKPREKNAINYNNALVDKYAAHPQISRIARHRHVPKPIYKAQIEQKAIRHKQKRKEANLRKHSKPGSVPFIPERSKHIVRDEA